MLLGIAELIVSLALLVGFYRNGQLRPLAAHSYRDGGGELAAVIRSMGAGQGRQPPVDIDMADLGGFVALFLMREWDTWTLDGWHQSRGGLLPTDQVV
jgi:hypothetical protein